MARQVGGGNFRLPSECFTDDELLMGLNMRRLNDFRDGYVHSFGFCPDLGSPAESFLGSGETESDEDDYLTGLSQKLAYTSFRDSSFYAENTMYWKLSGSPQSTLCSVVSGGGCCMPGLSRVSRVSVPPDVGNAVAWRSLLAAAERDARMRLIEETAVRMGLIEEIAARMRLIEETAARMRLIEETAAFRSGNPSFPLRKTDTTTDFTQGSGFYPNQSPVSHQELQAAQFTQLKQQQQAGSFWEQGEIAHRQMVRNLKNGVSGNQSSSMAPSWLEIQPCQPQRQRSSGTKAHFLGESETKSKRTGTGVFLPRNLGAATVEIRKKTDRVVQGMDFNFKSMDLQQSQSLTRRSDFLEANAALNHGNTVVSTSEQRRTLGAVPVRMNQELNLLPQEWTY